MYGYGDAETPFSATVDLVEVCRSSLTDFVYFHSKLNGVQLPSSPDIVYGRQLVSQSVPVSMAARTSSWTMQPPWRTLQWTKQQGGAASCSQKTSCTLSARQA